MAKNFKKLYNDLLVERRLENSKIEEELTGLYDFLFKNESLNLITTIETEHCLEIDTRLNILLDLVETEDN